MQEFEWDPRKNKRNIRKHGIDFKDSRIIFDGPFLKIRDNRKHYGEERWIVIGRLDGAIVVVACTYRGEKIRIISIRGATEREKKKFQKKT